MHVALGGSARTVEHGRVADYMAYYRTAQGRVRGPRGRGRRLRVGRDPPAGTYPEPVEHCDVCRWQIVCVAQRRADDDLSLVAGAPSRLRTRSQGGTPTRRGLAAMELPLLKPLEGVGVGLVERRGRRRPAIQVRANGRTLYELLPPRGSPTARSSRTGASRGREPRPGDLFFDIEGDPFALDDGVDYLFGILERARRGRRRADMLFRRSETAR